MRSMEYVPGAKGDVPNQNRLPAVCVALRHAREEAELTQEGLAGRLHLAQSTIQKWEGGREPRLDRIATLETAMGYRRGHLLRLAGYVEEASTAREALLADPSLTPNHRETMVASYDVSVQLSSKARSARVAKVPPTSATRSRS